MPACSCVTPSPHPKAAKRCPRRGPRRQRLPSPETEFLNRRENYPTAFAIVKHKLKRFNRWARPPSDPRHRPAHRSIRRPCHGRLGPVGTLRQLRHLHPPIPGEQFHVSKALYLQRISVTFSHLAGQWQGLHPPLTGGPKSPSAARLSSDLPYPFRRQKTTQTHELSPSPPLGRLTCQNIPL